MAYKKYGVRRRSYRSRPYMRRSRYGRSSYRRSFKGRRVGYSNIGGSKLDSLGYRNRRFNPRRQNRLNWNASNASQHYRSVGSTLLTAQLSPTTPQDMTMGFLPFMDQSFWTPAGGATATLGFPDDARIFLRGGMSTLRVENTDTDSTQTIKVWCIRTTANGLVGVAATPSNLWEIASELPTSWDPTVQTDFFKFWKVWKSYEFQLRPGEVWSLKRKIPSQRLDLTQYNALSKRDFYILGNNTLDTTTATINWTAEFNVSFSADTT